jgi:hypothetical protein
MRRVRYRHTPSASCACSAFLSTSEQTATVRGYPFAAGANDRDGNLSSVGNQYFSKTYMSPRMSNPWDRLCVCRRIFSADRNRFPPLRRACRRHRPLPSRRRSGRAGGSASFEAHRVARTDGFLEAGFVDSGKKADFTAVLRLGKRHDRAGPAPWIRRSGRPA